MNKLFTFLLIFIPIALFSQSTKEMLGEIEGKWELDNNNNVTFSKVIEVPGASKDDLYTRALSYFTYNYNSGDDVIQVEDKEKGTIIGKGLYSNAHIGVSLITTSVSTYHIVRIDIKDERARVIVSLTQYKIVITGGDTGPTTRMDNVSSRYPIIQKDAQKTVMTKAFYKSYQRAMSTFEKIEKTLKEGSSGHDVNDDW